MIIQQKNSGSFMIKAVISAGLLSISLIISPMQFRIKGKLPYTKKVAEGENFTSIEALGDEVIVSDECCDIAYGCFGGPLRACFCIDCCGRGHSYRINYDDSCGCFSTIWNTLIRIKSCCLPDLDDLVADDNDDLN